jgi:hypothetical protein
MLLFAYGRMGRGNTKGKNKKIRVGGVILNNHRIKR